MQNEVTLLTKDLFEAENKLVDAEQELRMYKRAFEAAKKYIEECPADPDIYIEQLEAWRKYQDILEALEEFNAN